MVAYSPSWETMKRTPWTNYFKSVQGDNFIRLYQ